MNNQCITVTRLTISTYSRVFTLPFPSDPYLCLPIDVCHLIRFWKVFQAEKFSASISFVETFALKISTYPQVMFYLVLMNI